MDNYQQSVAETFKFSQMLVTFILAGYRVEKEGTISQLGNFFLTKGPDNKIPSPIKAYQICFNNVKKQKVTLIVHCSSNHVHMFLAECSLWTAKKQNKNLETVCMLDLDRTTGKCLVGCPKNHKPVISNFSSKTFELYQKMEKIFFEESVRISDENKKKNKKKKQ